MPRSNGVLDPEISIDSYGTEIICCPNCSCTHGLQFIPMHRGTVYAQCLCGYGWELIGWIATSEVVQ